MFKDMFEKLEKHLKKTDEECLSFMLFQEDITKCCEGLDESLYLWESFDPGTGVDENGKVLPAFASWMKFRTRIAKIMKAIDDLIRKYKTADPAEPKSFAESIKPILEMGKGVLLDALEFENSQKTSDKTGDEPGATGDLDAIPPTRSLRIPKSSRSRRQALESP